MFDDVNPWLMAYLVSSAVVRRLSFFMILCRWVSIVLSAIFNLLAISFVVFPSAIN